MSKAGFWDDQAQSTKLMQELKSLKADCETHNVIEKELNDLVELSHLLEEDDAASIEELTRHLGLLEKKMSDLEFITLLGGGNDRNNAILSINAGAGGTESCDWVSMLFRMYSKWAQDRGFEIKVIDYLAGEEAGIKNVTVSIEGQYAYGYLKSESGVHRLVRISPFDSNKRRHTSFASVDVIPEITDEIKIDIKESDLRVDVYRASGPGGQGVNTTDSAVRITHIPTGVIVQCQNERSQLKNKGLAMKILKARLYEKEQKEREEKAAKEYGQKQQIAWGSQIRSYVFQPYTMVKDHRTDEETGDVNGVMDGKIDRFMEAYLKRQKSR